MNQKPIFLNVISWLFGALVLFAGFVNIFWGNDPGFGIFLALLSLVYLLPVNTFIEKIFNFSIPAIAKILLGIFIIWASLGVGELFEKIDLMMMDI